MLWHSEPGDFTAWPYPCPEDVTDVCVTGTMPSQPRHALLRFSGSSGASLASAVISTSGNGRVIGEGLFDPGVRNPEVMVAADSASVSWTQPLADIFTLPGASTDWGWNIDRVNRVGLFVGSVGAKPAVFTSTRVVDDLSRAMTVGFRLSNGTVAWRDPGTQYVCNQLPCPGATADGFNTAATMNAGGPTVGVSDSATGTVSGRPDSTEVTVSANAQATLEGFNPANGRVLWRYAAGHDQGLLDQQGLPPQVGANTIVLSTAKGQLATLDLATGSSHPTTQNASAWCRDISQYTEHVPYQSSLGPPDTTYIGQYSLYPCTSSGKQLPTPTAVPAFISAIGAQTDGLTAWSESKSIVAAASAPPA